MIIKLRFVYKIRSTGISIYIEPKQLKQCIVDDIDEILVYTFERYIARYIDISIKSRNIGMHYERHVTRKCDFQVLHMTTRFTIALPAGSKAC